MKTILVPLDGSYLAARALTYARALAANGGARLALVECVQVHSVSREEQAELEAKAADAAEYVIQSSAEALRRDGFETELHVVYGPAADGILTAAEAIGADLIVMSSHGRGGLGRLVHGSVADEVLRHSPVPVLVVPASAHPSDWTHLTDPVFVVALDGSELAERALPAAIELARQLGARLALLRIVEPLYSRYGYVDSLSLYGVTEPDPAEETALARAYLEPIAADIREQGIAADTIVEYGIPAPTMAEVAERLGALGVVVATHGRGGFARLVVGSVTTALLHQSKVPLLLVRPVSNSTIEAAERVLESSGRV